jgi:hypothetical protein
MYMGSEFQFSYLASEFSPHDRESRRSSYPASLSSVILQQVDAVFGYPRTQASYL